ncbi:hypothetical protein WKI13_18935 [Teredinibacter turnerae]|uniref:hypothetical protein n=1 Tax=Teredinibacter turnerae TaxID=2426 RepID=UPI000375D656|nr:hypothetical protein [Teredinibacter turnerae]
MKPGDLNSPRTQEEAIHNLWGAVFFQALKDDDPEWLEGADYFRVAELAGIPAALAGKVRAMLLAGKISRDVFKKLAPAVPSAEPEKMRTEYSPRSFNSIAKVKKIAESMHSQNPEVTAVEIRNACVSIGIKPSTAYSQAWNWLKRRADL